MAIIVNTTGDVQMKYAYLNIFPDQFKPEKDKLENDTWIKHTMDFFSTKSYQQYRTNRDTFAKNYDLLNGILTSKDFDEEKEVKDFMETLVTKEVNLPSYVKHYPIINSPINTLVGEMSKRPDIWKVKAFDDESKSEELSAKTSILQQFITQKIKAKIMMNAKISGQQLTDDEVEQKTMEQLQDELSDYTSTAEKWGNRVLEAQKLEFSMKEQAEEGFKDLLTVSREYYHIYEDSSTLGFNLEEVNPKNVCILTTPNKKYTSDPSGRGRGSHAVSIVDVMEISEIIERFPELNKEEIDHLRKGLENFGIMDARESNIGTSATGPNTVEYDTYNRLLLQERMMVESDMADPGNDDPYGNLFSLTSGVSAFGYKYVIITSYWQSKKLVGQLDYIDEMGNEQSMPVDENYVEGTYPGEIRVTWGWINQWYKGNKIGPDVYHISPLKILNYCPVIGLINNGKNSVPKSMVDLMKPAQMLYNVCMNQLFMLLKKEKGNMGVVNVRRIPRVKDGDGEDDIDVWEAEAETRGIMFDDDSPENMKSPVSNTTVIKNVDLTRTQEIQSRYNLAVQLRNECWKLVGISDQRVGEMTATETATNTNTAIAQSYAQTEPLFAAHTYLMNQVYQAIVDASLYTQSQLPTSSISYISNEGEEAFVEINGSELSMRKMKVYIASRPEDQKLFNEIRSLAQPLLQNGGSFLDVIELYSTNSIRQMKQTFRKLKQQQQEQADQENQIKQQQLAQQQQQSEAQLAQIEQQHQEDLADKDYQNELDRINKKEVALINQLGSNPALEADNNHNGEADALELANMQMSKDTADKDHKIKLLQLQQKEKDRQSKLEIEKAKLAAEREKSANDLKMRKLEIANRAKQSAKRK